MLVLSTIFFTLLSTRPLLAAPISHSPNTEIERRGEDRPTLIDGPFHLFTKPHENHHGHDVNLEPRQILDAIKLGYTVATNPTVDALAAQGAQTIAQKAPSVVKTVSKGVETAVHKVENGVKDVGSKIGGFFGGLFGHHSSGNSNKKATPAPAAKKAAPNKPTVKAAIAKKAAPKAAPKQAIKAAPAKVSVKGKATPSKKQ